MAKSLKCAFCRNTGVDRFRNDACRACGGSGTMVVPYDNSVPCNFCNASGADRFKNEKCRVCGGAGEAPPGIQSL